ncbi:hypothetical protein HMPREF3190_00169 [Umbribacter vaginalis]|nr:hypothetical protein HMPREF3190_00169 [Coriobacteriales bacterium DNF00809]
MSGRYHALDARKASITNGKPNNRTQYTYNKQVLTYRHMPET